MLVRCCCLLLSYLTLLFHFCIFVFFLSKIFFYPKVDTAKGLSIELNQYDCYNSPAAPNRCDGERAGELEKPGTNLFFIISCVLLGIICTTLIVSVLCYTGKPEAVSYDQDFASAGEHAPLKGDKGSV